MPSDNNPAAGIAGTIAAIPLIVGIGVGALTEAGAPIRIAPLDMQSLSLSQADFERIEEHAFGGLPSTADLYFRNGYVGAYDVRYRVPRWVGYRVVQSYRNTPPREGRFASFRIDRGIENPVRSADYRGLLASRGYARGHLAPYGVMGGDRDNDGMTAADDPDGFDAETVFQANLMSNIAPQHHKGFNNVPGLWGRLERFVQDRLVTRCGLEVWVFAGTIFGSGEPERVGRSQAIGVPPAFFKIVIRGSDAENGDDMPNVLAFLFPHSRVAHGELEDYLVPVDVIEALSGLNFFSDFGEESQDALEDGDTFSNWGEFDAACSGG